MVMGLFEDYDKVQMPFGVMDGFKVKVRLHQGSGIGPLLFITVMDFIIKHIQIEGGTNLIFP